MYESYFGLTGAPFLLNPDPSFFFDSRGHSSALSYLKFGLYQFDEADQERLRRQVVLKELRKCGQLVDALANWQSSAQSAEQAEFLYDVLGAWLKSELHKTVLQVEGKGC